MSTVNKYAIRIDQRNAGNTAYTESFVSGSSQVIGTDFTGKVVGIPTTFELLTKLGRLLLGKRFTSTTLNNTQEAYASVLQLDTTEIWSETNLIPYNNLPYSSSNIASTSQINGVIKYWYKYPLTVANDTTLANSVWYFLAPSGSNSGINSQFIDTNQQINFINPKYITASLRDNFSDADFSAVPGYNISLFTSTNGITFVPWAFNNYLFDYKTGVLQFIDANTPTNRVYVTVYQYIGKSASDSFASGSNYAVSSSYFSGSTISASNVNIAQTASINILNVNTASVVYFALNNSGSAPSSSIQNGSPGEMRFDDNYVYIYTNNVWTRIPKARWN